MVATTIEPFRADIGDDVLDDLRQRLRATRWPARETVDGWTQGVPLDQARRLVEHWIERYDWRRCEALLDGFGQYRTGIDGLSIHFLHRRSPQPDALPLILTHGWPGSVIEFHKVIDALADPVAHGGRAEDAFHVVVPSLPGYGFSDKPGEAGWSVERIACAWAVLMQRLGHSRYVAQGGDWGSAVTTALAQTGGAAVAGIHLNMIVAPSSAEDVANATEAEKASLAALQTLSDRWEWLCATTAHPAADIGLRPGRFAGRAGDVDIREVPRMDRLRRRSVQRAERRRDARQYHAVLAEQQRRIVGAAVLGELRSFVSGTVDVPTACSLFPKEIFPPSRRWADKRYRNIVYWNQLPKGGHFAAFEQPELFVEELRKGFRGMR